MPSEDFTPPIWLKRARRQRLVAAIRTEVAWIAALAMVALVVALAATILIGPPSEWGPAFSRLLGNLTQRTGTGPAG